MARHHAGFDTSSSRESRRWVRTESSFLTLNISGPWTEEWPLRICDIDRSARTKPPLDGNPLLESLSRRFLFIPEATSGKPPKLPRAIPLARGTLVNNEWMFPTKWDHVLAEVC